MAWIESHEELPTHPKTRKLARRLNIGLPTAIGHLHMLWWWCLTHRPDGVLHDMDVEDIADAAGWIDNPVAFVDAMFDAGWLDDNGDTLQVHDWWDGAGKTIKRRKYTTERQRRLRDRQQDTDPNNDSNGDVTRDATASDVVDSDRDSDRDKKSKTVSRKRATQATVIPQDWTPTPEPDLIRSVGGQKTADRELDKFRDYWIAQPGAKGRKKDWQATWRNWLRNSQDFRQRPSVPEPAQVSKPVVGSDDWDQREERQRELERKFLGDAG